MIKKAILFLKNPSITFLLKVVTLYTLCSIFIVKATIFESFNNWLCQNIANSSAVLLKLIGLNATSSLNQSVLINGVSAVYIGTPCNGFEFFALFICFVIAYPSKIIHKIWFIPIGILSIHLLNIIRVSALALNWLYSKGSFDFNHKYTFVLFVYGLLFLLWVQWAKRFAIIEVNETN